MQESLSGIHVLAAHDGPLVALSFIISIFAAYTAVSTLLQARRMSRVQPWLIGGGIAYGCGVWAMHFTGMTAMSAGGLVSYQTGLTLLSLLIAILGAYLAFRIANGALTTGVRVGLSGTVLGASIGAMHYTGMAAMRGAFAVSFDPLWVLLSVLVAIVIGTLGMGLLITTPTGSSGLRHLLSALLVGLAIPLMHYTAMLATVLERRSEGVVVVSSGLTINAILVVAIAAISVPLFLSSLVEVEATAARSS